MNELLQRTLWILFGPFWEHMPANLSSLRPSTTCCQEAYVRVAILVLPLQVGPESIKAVEVLPKIHENTGSQLNGSLQTIFALKIVKFCALGKSAPAGPCAGAEQKAPTPGLCVRVTPTGSQLNPLPAISGYFMFTRTGVAS